MRSLLDLTLRLGVAALAVVLAATAGGSADMDETPFLAENRATMDRMMAGMEVAPTGDVDRDFAAMMIAHHQGAIDMARAELRHGRNERLRRIAQGIVVEQQQEIEAMRLALGQPPLSPSAAVPPDQPPNPSAPTAPRPASMPTMTMQKERP